LTLSASSAEHLCHGAVSVCPSVCRVNRQQQRHAAGLPQRGCGWQISIDSCRRAAACCDPVVFLPAQRYAHGYLLWPRVCLSVTSRSSIETDKRIELVFGVGATSTFRLSYTNLFKGNMGRPIFKNKGTFLRNFIQNSREKKICFGISIVETCYGLCSRMVDAQSVINCTVVGQLS